MTGLKIGVVIPWREQPTRLPIFNAVLDWYSKNLPDAEIFLSDRKSDVWSMSGSRNDGVSIAKELGCDVIVLNDADTFPQIGPLLETIQAAASDDKIHLPYTQYRFLNENYTREFFDKGTPLESFKIDAINLAECSGVNVFSPKAWDAIGGGDEKFQGWGFEDNAMYYVHQVVHGIPYIKHNGLVFALYHKTQPGVGVPDQNVLNNKALYELYKTKKNKEEVLDLVKSKAPLEDLININFP
jgi:hypothetical protein